MERAHVDIKYKIARIVQRLDLPIEGETTLLRTAIDSLEFVELIMMVEEEFNIEISHEQAALLLTLNDFSYFVFKATCK